MKKVVIVGCCLLVTLVMVPTGLLAAEGSLVDWAAVFNADGSVNNLSGGFDAVFLQDKISAGFATDMSALDPASRTVFNGPVETAHDLGNGYVLAARDASGNLLLYAAVERLNSNADSYVDIEFNQGKVGLTPGDPWPMYGSKTVNDIRVRFDFSAGNLTTVTVGKWNGNSFSNASSAVSSQPGCLILSSAVDFCNGAPLAGLPQANQEVWDGDYKIVEAPAANGFLEVLVNVGNLLGTNVEYTSIVMSTPQDIALGSFQAMGYWSALGNALATQ